MVSTRKVKQIVYSKDYIIADCGANVKALAHAMANEGVPVNEFNKWYRDTHKRIQPIQVDGAPASEAKEYTAEGQNSSQVSVRIAVTISMSNGVFEK